MLLYAASYDGQGAIAMRAGKDYAKLTGESFYEVLTLIRFGRFDEVLEVTNRPKPEIQGGLWDFAQGYAHLKQGDADFAAALSGAREEGRRDVDRRVPRPHGEEPARRSWPASSKARSSARPAISPAPSRRSSAPPACRRASSTTSRSRCRSRRSTGSAPRSWRARRFDEAEQAYRAELKDHPHNGWSLLGLQQALAGQGMKSAEVDADLAASWSRADTWIRSSRF